MRDDELEQLLVELSALTSDQPHISAFLLELRDACVRTPAKVQTLVSDLRLWGGMGSVADQASVNLPAEEQSRVHELLIRLYELLELHGVTDARGASWVEIFRQWRDLDIPQAEPS